MNPSLKLRQTTETLLYYILTCFDSQHPRQYPLSFHNINSTSIWNLAWIWANRRTKSLWVVALVFTCCFHSCSSQSVKPLGGMSPSCHINKCSEMMYWCHVWHLQRKRFLAVEEKHAFKLNSFLQLLYSIFCLSLPIKATWGDYHFHTYYTLSNASTSICLLIFQTWMTPSVKTMTPWGRLSITSWRMKVCVQCTDLTKAFFTVINVTFYYTSHTNRSLFRAPSMKRWQLALHYCSSRHILTHYPGRKCLSM